MGSFDSIKPPASKTNTVEPDSPTPDTAAQQNRFLGRLAGDGFGLAQPVGPGAVNRPDDVQRVETVLDGAGLLGRRPGRRFGDDTAKAITEGQRAFNRDHAAGLGLAPLKEDGLVNPEGPTHAATRKLAGGLLGRQDQVRRIEAIREDGKRAPAPKSLLDPAPEPRPQPRPQPRPWWKHQSIRPIDAAGQASNARTVRHMGTVTSVGDMPRWTADALETAGDKGIDDVADLLNQLQEADPEQAGRLARETHDKLSQPTRQKLAAMERPAEPAAPAAKPTKPRQEAGDGNGLAARLKRLDRQAEANTWDAPTQLARRDQLHGRDALSRLRQAVESPDALTDKDRRAIMNRLDTAFPHLSGLRQEAQSLVDRAGSAGERRDDKQFLRDLERKVADPAIFEAQADIRRFNERFPEAERDKLFAKRGQVRETMETGAAGLFATAAQRQEQDTLIERWRDAAAAGDPNARQIVRRAEAKAAELDAAMAGQARRVGEAAVALTQLPGHPHPDLDPKGAQAQRTGESAVRRNNELLTDAGLLAVGGAGGAVAKGGGRALKAAATSGGAVSTYSRGFDGAIRDTLRKSGVDPTDATALKAFAEKNPSIIAKATNRALADAATNLVSGKAAEALNRAIGGSLGTLGEETIGRGIEKTIGKLFDPIE